MSLTQTSLKLALPLAISLALTACGGGGSGSSTSSSGNSNSNNDVGFGVGASTDTSGDTDSVDDGTNDSGTDSTEAAEVASLLVYADSAYLPSNAVADGDSEGSDPVTIFMIAKDSDNVALSDITFTAVADNGATLLPGTKDSADGTIKTWRLIPSSESTDQKTVNVTVTAGNVTKVFSIDVTEVEDTSDTTTVDDISDLVVYANANSLSKDAVADGSTENTTPVTVYMIAKDSNNVALSDVTFTAVTDNDATLLPSLEDSADGTIKSWRLIPSTEAVSGETVNVTITAGSVSKVLTIKITDTDDISDATAEADITDLVVYADASYLPSDPTAEPVTIYMIAKDSNNIALSNITFVAGADNGATLLPGTKDSADGTIKSWRLIPPTDLTEQRTVNVKVTVGELEKILSIQIADTEDTSDTTAVDDIDTLVAYASSGYLNTDATADSSTAGSEPITIYMIAKDSDNTALSNVTFNAASDSNDVILLPGTEDSADGIIKTVRLAIKEPKNQTVTIKVTAGGEDVEPVYIDIDVVGTTLEIDGTENISIAEPMSYTVKLVDASGKALPKRAVSISSELITESGPVNSNLINIAPVETDSKGEAQFKLEPITGSEGKYIITAEVEELGDVVATKNITVLPNTLTLNLDNDTPQGITNKPYSVTVNWTASNGETLANRLISLSTTLGVILDNQEVTTDAAGNATFRVQSSTEGTATITAKDKSTGLSTTLEMEYTESKVDSILISASADSLAIDADNDDSTEGSEPVTISMTAKDAAGVALTDVTFSVTAKGADGSDIATLLPGSADSADGTTKSWRLIPTADAKLGDIVNVEVTAGNVTKIFQISITDTSDATTAANVAEMTVYADANYLPSDPTAEPVTVYMIAKDKDGVALTNVTFTAKANNGATLLPGTKDSADGTIKSWRLIPPTQPSAYETVTVTVTAGNLPAKTLEIKIGESSDTDITEVVAYADSNYLSSDPLAEPINIYMTAKDADGIALSNKTFSVNADGATLLPGTKDSADGTIKSWRLIPTADAKHGDTVTVKVTAGDAPSKTLTFTIGEASAADVAEVVAYTDANSLSSDSVTESVNIYMTAKDSAGIALTDVEFSVSAASTRADGTPITDGVIATLLPGTNDSADGTLKSWRLIPTTEAKPGDTVEVTVSAGNALPKKITFTVSEASDTNITEVVAYADASYLSNDPLADPVNIYMIAKDVDGIALSDKTFSVTATATRNGKATDGLIATLLPGIKDSADGTIKSWRLIPTAKAESGDIITITIKAGDITEELKITIDPAVANIAEVVAYADADYLSNDSLADPVNIYMTAKDTAGVALTDVMFSVTITDGAALATLTAGTKDSADGTIKSWGLIPTAEAKLGDKVVVTVTAGNAPPQTVEVTIGEAPDTDINEVVAYADASYLSNDPLAAPVNIYMIAKDVDGIALSDKTFSVTATATRNGKATDGLIATLLPGIKDSADGTIKSWRLIPTAKAESGDIVTITIKAGDITEELKITIDPAVANIAEVVAYADANYLSSDPLAEPINIYMTAKDAAGIALTDVAFSVIATSKHTDGTKSTDLPTLIPGTKDSADGTVKSWGLIPSAEAKLGDTVEVTVTAGNFSEILSFKIGEDADTDINEVVAYADADYLSSDPLAEPVNIYMIAKDAAGIALSNKTFSVSVEGAILLPGTKDSDDGTIKSWRLIPTADAKPGDTVVVTVSAGSADPKELEFTVDSTAQKVASLVLYSSSRYLLNDADDDDSTEGSEPVIIYMMAKDSNNIALSNISFNPSVNGDATLLEGSVSSDGTLTTWRLVPGPSMENKTVTVTVEAGGIKKELPIEITGTTAQIDGPSSIPVGTPTTYTVKLTDAADEGIPYKNVTFSVISDTGLVTIDPQYGLTDDQGEVQFTFESSDGGSYEITAAVDDLNDIKPNKVVVVSSDNFSLSSCSESKEDSSSNCTPKEEPEIALGDFQRVDFTWTDPTKYEVANAKAEIYLSATRGTLWEKDASDQFVEMEVGQPVTVQQTSGEAEKTFYIKSSTAGGTVITATDNSTMLTGSLVMEFISETPKYLITQASPPIITSLETSTISAQVRDENDNPVKGQVVVFNLDDTVDGKLSSSKAETNSSGRASIVYTAGNGTSAKDDVMITSYLERDADDYDTPLITDTTYLTVGGEAVRLVLGTSEALEEDGDTYQKTYTAIVTDIAGNPVSGKEVSFNILSTEYIKGELTPEPYGFSEYIWTNKNTPVVCTSEDKDFDGTRDENEDLYDFYDYNNNGRLDPHNAASIQLIGITDDAGRATTQVTYLQSYALWENVQITAQVTVNGTEYLRSTKQTLPVLSADIITESEESSPPNRTSPYGTGSSCAISN